MKSEENELIQIQRYVKKQYKIDSLNIEFLAVGVQRVNVQLQLSDQPEYMIAAHLSSGDECIENQKMQKTHKTCSLLPI